MPRPKKKLPSHGLETIRELAERGVKQTDICKALNISYPTWLRIKEENEQVKETLEEAQKIEHDKLMGVLYEQAMDGNTTAAIFLLKTRHNYRENSDVLNASQVNVQITVPGSMNPEEYKKKLEFNNESE